MTRNEAKSIAKLIHALPNIAESNFKLLNIIKDKELKGFHQWADGRAYEGGFLIQKGTKDHLWLLFSQWSWRQTSDYYLVLFPQSKVRPIAEIHHTISDAGETTLVWKYQPRKQDDLNEQRRKYFVDAFGSETAMISAPIQPSDVENFLSELFSLAEIRIKADILDKNLPIKREGFPEGKLIERAHLARERNLEVVRRAKEEAFRNNGHLRCACCGFDFFDRYGEIGNGYIEAHHTKPLSELHNDGGITELKDIALVCSNCHRMLHRRRPWLQMHELTELLNRTTD